MSSSPPSFVNVANRLGVPTEQFYSIVRQALYDLRVAIPAKVVSFDAIKQTVKVQPAIRERINKQLIPTDVDLPQLVDVPILVPRGGGYSITFPIVAGDECLIIFADMCIDAWYQSGGTANAQADKRRHDLSDGIAVFGIWSQPRKLINYATDKVQVRNDSGTTHIDIDSGGKIVLVSATEIDLTAPTIKITGSTLVDIEGGHAKIDNKVFLAHQHSGVQTGGGNSGGVV